MTGRWVTVGRFSVWSLVYLVVMIATIVGLDIAFFQHHTAWRLVANIGTVAVFLVGYLIIFRPFRKQ